METCSTTRSLLSQIPKAEKEFLIRTAREILSSLRRDSLEELCSAVAKVHEDKEYGWEEAILCGQWYRYPSEIQNGRFCSEEALKNYLLLRALGVNVEYYVLENYQATGMAHELVLVPNGERPILIDWSLVTPVKKEEHFFAVEGKEPISFGKIYLLEEEEILERVLGLRTGQRFLDAVRCGQVLYRKKTEEGELEGQVKWDPENQELTFTFGYLPYTETILSYFTHTIRYGTEVEIEQEFGISRGASLRQDERIPILTFNHPPKERDALEQIIGFPNRMGPNQKRLLAMEVYYRWATCSEDASEGRYVYSPEKRTEIYLACKTFAEKGEMPEQMRRFMKDQLRTYDHLREHNPSAAERFFDFQCTTMFLDQQYPTEEDLFRYFGENHQLSHFGVCMEYFFISVGALGKQFSSRNLLSSSDILVREISQRIGKDIPLCNIDSFLQFIDDFSAMSDRERFGYSR